MKSIVSYLFFALLIFVGSWSAWSRFNARRKRVDLPEKNIAETLIKELKDGDIIFQTSKSSQSKAIQLATHSKYSHCGLIYKKDNSLFVCEAVEPVKMTPITTWIARGENNHFVVKRLRDSERLLTQSALQKMKQSEMSLLGKHYDKFFEWSNDRIYCSELIWKVYNESTGLEIGTLERLKDFDLENETVREILKERYGNNIPVTETVISPASIFNSPLLSIVISE